MSDKMTDEQLLHHVRCMLDRATQEMEEKTAARLRRGRLAALEIAGQRRAGWFGLPRWATTGAFTAVAIMAVAMSLWVASPRQDLPLRQPDEVEILTAQDNLELYEDLEFYRWLADEEGGERGVAR